MLLVPVLVVSWFGVFWVLAWKLTGRHAPLTPEAIPSVDWASFRELRLRTSDGEELGAWLDETPGRNGPVVLITHGNGGKRTDALHVAEWAARAGMRSLLITHRAHGDSSGERNDFGYSARHDIVAAVRLLRELDPDAQIVVWGRSLGSAAALFAAPELSGEVAGYIVECPYHDLQTAIRHRMDLRLPPPLSTVATLSFRAVAPVALPQMKLISPVKAAANVPADLPVLVLCGGRDRRARTFEASAIHSALGQRSEFVLIEGGDHLKLRDADSTTYDAAVLGFLNRWR